MRAESERLVEAQDSKTRRRAKKTYLQTSARVWVGVSEKAGGGGAWTIQQGAFSINDEHTRLRDVVMYDVGEESNGAQAFRQH